MPDKISFMSENSATLRALISFFFGSWWYISRVVVKLLLSFNNLLLSITFNHIEHTGLASNLCGSTCGISDGTDIWNCKGINHI